MTLVNFTSINDPSLSPLLLYIDHIWDRMRSANALNVQVLKSSNSADFPIAVLRRLVQLVRIVLEALTKLD